MRGVDKISYVFFFFFFFFFAVLPQFSVDSNNTVSSSTEVLTVSSNRTIESLDGGVFQLGVIAIGSNSSWYLSIWYKEEYPRRPVWIANRDNPLPSSIGILRVSGTELVLSDHSNKYVWSTRLTRHTKSPLVGKLLKNGNFVLRDKEEGGFLWQSFDYPTDTLLPEMKLGWDRGRGINNSLISWKSPTDPSFGNFTYEVSFVGLPDLLVRDNGTLRYRRKPDDNIQRTDKAGQPFKSISNNFTNCSDQATYSFTVDSAQRLFWRLSSDGLIELRGLKNQTPIWQALIHRCDRYGRCGPNSYCDSRKPPYCYCIKGFRPKNPKKWHFGEHVDGCERNTQLQCHDMDFDHLENIKLPITKEVTIHRKVHTGECRPLCIRDCNCKAYAETNSESGMWDCVLWTGDLIDIRTYDFHSPDLYVRLAASKPGKRNNKVGIIVGSIAGVGIMLLLLSLAIFCIWTKKKRKLAREISAPPTTDNNLQQEVGEVTMFSFRDVVEATEHFAESNKLGRGGFGTVYKGKLPNGKDVAVKRLGEMSSQGIEEFQTEVKLIGRLRHLNLVRLEGFCIEAQEKILVYEFLENSSLDKFLFGNTGTPKLDWVTRKQIIIGIARGILYLHRDSQVKIIHRDLKASNILLDKDMIPKISDFGMARTIGKDDSEILTRKIAGTRGYLSPECMDGIYSIKSDVFSFGVMMIETLTGEKNIPYNRDMTLIQQAWLKWEGGVGVELVDARLMDSTSTPSTGIREILKFLQIGLLCVQEHAADRPTMDSVIRLLESENMDTPAPNPPACCPRPRTTTLEPGSSSTSALTLNQITLSTVHGR